MVQGITPTATPATTTILTAPNSFLEAEAFARLWLTTVLEARALGWQLDYRVAWDSEGRFISATIEKQFVGFDLKQKVDEAIEALQYDKPIDELRGTLLHLLLEKKCELEGKPGRPTGSPWAGTIWTIAHLFKCSGFPLSRNSASPETSAFDAIAKAMLELKLNPNSYSGVRANFYDYAKRSSVP